MAVAKVTAGNVEILALHDNQSALPLSIFMAICHHTGFGRVARLEGRRYWQGI